MLSQPQGPGIVALVFWVGAVLTLYGWTGFLYSLAVRHRAGARGPEHHAHDHGVESPWLVSTRALLIGALTCGVIGSVIALLSQFRPEAAHYPIV
jgi:hypothetical protein